MDTSFKAEGSGILAAIPPALIIAGIDEAGRGSVAGPVVAGACVITTPLFRRRATFPRWSPFRRNRSDDILIADSKLLSPEQREVAFGWITATYFFGVGIVPADVIEERGILYATNQAMNRALKDLRKKVEPAFLHIDGRDNFSFPLPHRSIIRGDSTHPEIAAASIVAKVTRDNLMRTYAKEFSLYEFAKHKGYGTEEHLELIRKHGPCAIHRKSFLKAILEPMATR